METYELAEIYLLQGTQSYNLMFTRAKLMIVSDHGSLLWFIDADGIPDHKLLQHYAESDEINVQLRMATIGGRQLIGQGFFHPNPQHQAAAIRGDGPLIGYDRGPN